MPGITIDNIKNWPPKRFELALREAMESTSPVDALIVTVASEMSAGCLQEIDARLYPQPAY